MGWFSTMDSGRVRGSAPWKAAPLGEWDREMGWGTGMGWDGMGCQDRVPVNGNRSGMWKGFSTMDSARERGP